MVRRNQANEFGNLPVDEGEQAQALRDRAASDVDSGVVSGVDALPVILGQLLAILERPENRQLEAEPVVIETHLACASPLAFVALP